MFNKKIEPKLIDSEFAKSLVDNHCLSKFFSDDIKEELIAKLQKFEDTSYFTIRIDLDNCINAYRTGELSSSDFRNCWKRARPVKKISYPIKIKTLEFTNRRHWDAERIIQYSYFDDLTSHTHYSNIRADVEEDYQLILSENEYDSCLGTFLDTQNDLFNTDFKFVKKHLYLTHQEVAEHVLTHFNDVLEVKMYYLSMYKSDLLNGNVYDWLVSKLTEHYPKEIGELLFEK